MSLRKGKLVKDQYGQWKWIPEDPTDPSTPRTLRLPRLNRSKTQG